MRGSSEWKNSKGHAVMVSKNMFDSMYRCLDSGCGSINQTTTADEEEGGVPMADAATDGAAASARLQLPQTTTRLLKMFWYFYRDFLVFWPYSLPLFLFFDPHLND